MMDCNDEGNVSSLECQSAIGVFKDSVDTVRKQIGSWRNEQEKKKSENALLRDQLRNVECLFKDAQLQVAMKSQLKETYDADIEKLTTLLEKANAENFRLCSDCCKLETSVEKEQNKVIILQQQVESTNSIISEVRKDADAILSEKIELIAVCRSLEEKLKDRNEEFTRLISDRENEQSLTEKKLSELSAKLAEATGSSDLFSQQLREQRRCSEALQEKLQLTQHKNTKLQTKLEKISNEKETLSKLMDDETSKLNKKIETLSNALSKETSIRLSAAEMNSILQQKLEQLLSKEKKLENDNEQFRALLENVKNENKDLKLRMDFKKEQFEAAEIQYKNVIEKLQQTLANSRLEIKESAKEISDLHKEQLMKEFEITEHKRSKNESETALKLKQEVEQALYKRNEELESQVCQLRVILNSSNQNRRSQDADDTEESCLIGQMFKRLNQSRERYSGNKQQQQVMQSHILQVAQLQQQLKDKDCDNRAAKIEMQYMKEELERVKFKGIAENSRIHSVEESSYFNI